MKKVAIFSIPAHGHTNPILPVAAALVRRGNAVRFYSFGEFKSKVERTGAAFVSCDQYLPSITAEEEENLKKVSATEMSVQDIRITIALSDFLEKEFKSFQPDVVYSDSVCFWGKLNAWKFNVPLVVSTSTFAFNRVSSKYTKRGPGEMAGLIFGLPKVQKEFKKLKDHGYQCKSFLSLVENDNSTDTVVYTSKDFQPCSESFSEHYAFVGPSVFFNGQPEKSGHRPLVYISLGTVINERPGFYKRCIEALKDEDVDVIISCGKETDRERLGELPANVKVYPSVNQLEVLAKTNVFITHCGMNSVSESLYMAAPMVLYPQTTEQYAVAKRTAETGAGIMLKDDSAQGIRAAVRQILQSPGCSAAAEERCRDFRSCSGAEGAAAFIENAPNPTDGRDVIKTMKKADVITQVVYGILTIALGNVLFRFIDIGFLWLYILAAVVLAIPVKSLVLKVVYHFLTSGERSSGAAKSA